MIHHRFANHTRVIDEAKKIAGASFVSVQNEEQAVIMTIKPEGIYDFISRIKNDPSLAFIYFIDLTAVDYSKYPRPMSTRYGIVYTLLSPHQGVRIQILAHLPSEKPEIRSVTDLFQGAQWAEREVYDMYGIQFTGHPDLKRILMPDDFEGFPLRKDYPLKGRGERSSFAVYRSTPGHGAREEK